MPRRYERGATLWGVLFCFIMAGFLVFLAFKIAPTYLDNWQIESALASVSKRPEIHTMTSDDLRSAVRRQFDVGYVNRVRVSKDLHIEHTLHGNRVMVFRYNVRVPIIYNITAVVHFVDRRRVPGS